MESSESFFSGKRTLVTGGATGIGKGIVLALAQQGASLVVFDYSEHNLELLRQELPGIETRTVDVRNWKRTEDAVRSVLPIHLLVNNVGCGLTGTITSLTEGQYNDIFNTNVKSYFNVTRCVVEYLIRNELPGSIVNISSIATSVPLPNTVLYTSSKYAIDGFTKALAQELGPKNIRVNAINPALVRTNMTKDLCEDQEKLNQVMRRMPLQRLVSVQDVADAVLFLLSDNAQVISGVCLPVDAAHAVS